MKESAKSMKEANINQGYYEELWGEDMLEYLRYSAGSRWFDYLLSIILKEVNGPEVQEIADIGCGVGLHTKVLAETFSKAHVTGFDFSVSGIATAKKSHKLNNIDFSVNDITSSRYKKKYDIITAFDVLEHIDDWKALIRSLVKVNNKYFILASPVGRMRSYEQYIGHYRNFKRGEIEAYMQELGYKTVKTFYAGFPFYSPLLRDITNAFYKRDSPVLQTKMTTTTKLVHQVWFLLFKYLSLKNKGDNFIGLFEKEEIKTP